jgi:hypothetical protein
MRNFERKLQSNARRILIVPVEHEAVVNWNILLGAKLDDLLSNDSAKN